jgi:glutathione S-transferase
MHLCERNRAPYHCRGRILTVDEGFELDRHLDIMATERGTSELLGSTKAARVPFPNRDDGRAIAGTAAVLQAFRHANARRAMLRTKQIAPWDEANPPLVESMHAAFDREPARRPRRAGDRSPIADITALCPVDCLRVRRIAMAPERADLRPRNRVRSGASAAA